MITDHNMLARAIAAKLATPQEIKLYERQLDPDFYSDLTPEERDLVVLRSCSSGVWSTCPQPCVLIDDRPVLVPPGHRRKRAPSPSSDPPVNQDESNEGVPT